VRGVRKVDDAAPRGQTEDAERPGNFEPVGSFALVDQNQIRVHSQCECNGCALPCSKRPERVIVKSCNRRHNRPVGKTRHPFTNQRWGRRMAQLIMHGIGNKHFSKHPRQEVNVIEGQ
jgi:hypothetical protein